MRKTLANLALLFSAIILFALPQPTFVLKEGLPFLSYIAFLPVFLLVRRLPWKTVWLWGIAYGAFCYCFFTSWLGSFHPMGMILIASLYGFQLMIVFLLLKAASVLFKKHGWLVQWVVWCAYEYVKTTGFAGFNYGVTGYSHWQCTLLIQCVSIVGVWGLSAFITFPSAWLSAVFQESCVERNFDFGYLVKTFKESVLKHRKSGIAWLLCFVIIISYGIFSQIDYSQNETKKVVLLQSNTDPWVGGFPSYKRDFKTLSSLSTEALEENPNVDFVVWPETAFIPKIRWHYQTRKDRDRFNLVMDLLTYLDTQKVPFIIGNDDGVLSHWNTGEYGVVDYNATMLFRPGENCIPPEPETYHKIHLVPFTEYFPFEKMFPRIYEALLNGDTHLWEPGVEPVVFSVAGVFCGTPICFEDTFGEMGRLFVNNGAQVLVNLSNDAWSKSIACQYQHLSMAVFRSVENRVPSVRSTASGQTCIIDPNGKITAMLEPFSANYLVGEFPVMDIDKKTPYTLFGDWCGKLFAFLALLLLVFGLSKNLAYYIKNKKQ